MPRPPELPTPRQVVSANLKALMAARPDLNTIKKVVAASGVSNGKVGRIYAASHTTDIDALADLARIFELEPWHLLVPNLDPRRIPTLSTTPLLEQVRSLVQNAVPQTGESNTEVSAGVSSSEAKSRKASGQQRRSTPTLDSVSLVTLKEGDGGKRSRTEAVQEPRSGRNAARASRARGGR